MEIFGLEGTKNHVTPRRPPGKQSKRACSGDTLPCLALPVGPLLRWAWASMLEKLDVLHYETFALNFFLYGANGLLVRAIHDFSCFFGDAFLFRDVSRFLLTSSGKKSARACSGHDTMQGTRLFFSIAILSH